MEIWTAVCSLNLALYWDCRRDIRFGPRCRDVLGNDTRANAQSRCVPPAGAATEL